MSDSLQQKLSAKRLGQYLVDEGVLTPDQLNEALERQKRMGRAGFHVLLGTILEEMGVIDRQNLEAVILRQRLDDGSVSLGGEADWTAFRSTATQEMLAEAGVTERPMPMHDPGDTGLFGNGASTQPAPASTQRPIPPPPDIASSPSSPPSTQTRQPSSMQPTQHAGLRPVSPPSSQPATGGAPPQSRQASPAASTPINDRSASTPTQDQYHAAQASSQSAFAAPQPPPTYDFDAPQGSPSPQQPPAYQSAATSAQERPSPVYYQPPQQVPPTQPVEPETRRPAPAPEARNSTVRIHGFTFNRLSDGGLAEQEVAPAIAQLIRRNKTLEEQLTSLSERAEHIDSLTKLAEQTIKAADTIAEQIREEAESQAAAIRERAQQEARQLVSDANARYEEVLRQSGERARQLAIEIAKNLEQQEALNHRLHEIAERVLHGGPPGASQGSS